MKIALKIDLPPPGAVGPTVMAILPWEMFQSIRIYLGLSEKYFLFKLLEGNCDKINSMLHSAGNFIKILSP